MTDARTLGKLVIWLAVLTALQATPLRAGDGPEASREHGALQRALRLVRVEAAVSVKLIDPDLAPDPEPLRRLDAFVVREPGGALRPVIYINLRSETVRHATRSDFGVAVLAAVIHHEWHHLKGASETEACRAEVAFFRSLVNRGLVGRGPGGEYLRLLARRDDDGRLTAR